MFAHEQFKVEIYRAEGYGLQINTWRSALEREDYIVVDFFALDALTKGTAEWFYSLDARFISASLTVGLGLHDSSALYVEAPNNALNQLKALFSDISYKKVHEYRHINEDQIKDRQLKFTDQRTFKAFKQPADQNLASLFQHAYE